MKLLLILSFLVDFVISKPTITSVSDKRFDFGYIPHYDVGKKSLYVTNPGISLVRYDLPTNHLYEGKFIDTDFKVDFFLPTNECENCFVASAGLNVYIVNWDGYDSNVKIVRKAATLPGTENLTYVNTARTDPKNRLLVGTWRYDRCNPNGNSPNGSVLSIQNGNAEAIINGAQYPSGFEWNKVTSEMYYIDICALNIKAFDWSAIDGTVKNPKIIYDFRDDFPFQSAIAPYLPVGMSINCDGNLMVGLFNTSTVAEINPRTGKLLNRITMPAETITGVVYGGDHLDTMFVTSSVRKSDFYGNKEPESSNPESGKIFMIKGLGSKGCAGRSAENV